MLEPTEAALPADVEADSVAGVHPDEVTVPAVPDAVSQSVPLDAPEGEVAPTVTELSGTHAPFTMAPALPLVVVHEVMVVVWVGTQLPLIMTPTVPLLVSQACPGGKVVLVGSELEEVGREVEEVGDELGLVGCVVGVVPLVL